MAATTYVVFALLLFAACSTSETDFEDETSEALLKQELINSPEDNLEPQAAIDPQLDELVRATDEAGEADESAVSSASDLAPSDAGETSDPVNEAVEEEFVATKAFCLGCPTDVGEDSDKIKELSEFALASINEAVNSDKAQGIVRIVKATQQVVSGLKYEITLEVGDTACGKSATDCSESQVIGNGPTRQCHVVIIEQAWVNRQEVLDTTCSGGDPVPAAAKRDVAGAPEDVDLTSPDVLGKAQFALETLDTFDENDKKRILVQVLEALKQEAGYLGSETLYRMKLKFVPSDCAESSSNCEIPGDLPNVICDVQVLYQPWRTQPNKLIDSQCAQPTGNDAVGSKVPSSVGKNIKARSPLSEDLEDSPFVGEVPSSFVVKDVPVLGRTSIRGGVSPADPKSTDIQSYADFAMDAVNAQSNDASRLGLVKIRSAAVQIVAGKNVILELEVSPTDCPKSEDPVNCTFTDDSSSQVCEVVVWDRPWLSDKRVTNVNCNGVPKQNTPGGYEPIDVNDPQVQQIAEFSTAAIGQFLNSGDEVSVVTVESAQTQVVAGLNYNLSLVVCAGGSQQRCQVVVFDQPWTNTRSVTSLQCSPLETARKGLAGGYTPENPLDSKIQEIAVFSMATIGQQLNSGSTAELVKVVTAASQVVAGTNYKLKLIARVGQIQHSCEVVVFDQPWTNTRKVSAVRCDPIGNKQQRDTAILIGGIPLEDPSISQSPRVEGNPPVIGGVPLEDPSISQSPQVEGNPPVIGGVPLEDPSISQSPQVGGSQSLLVGGYSPVDSTDPTVQEIALFSTAAIGKGINGGDPVQLIKVESAATQVVAGTNYKLNLIVQAGENQHSCQVVVWDQSWTKTREVSSMSCNPLQSSRQSSSDTATRQSSSDTATRQLSSDTATRQSSSDMPTRQSSSDTPTRQSDTATRQSDTATRQSDTATRQLSSGKVSRQLNVRRVPQGRNTRPLDGGYKEQDPKDPDIQQIASFSTQAIAQQINGGNSVTLDAVVKAATQVVSGINYKLQLAVTADGEQNSCEVIVWDQPWTKTRKVTSLSCSPVSSRRRRQTGSLSGGWSKTNVTDSKIREIADYSLKILNERTNDNNLLQTVRILGAQQQVVSGINYKIELEVASTTCRKGQETKSCNEDPSQARQICMATVWDRPWLNQREVTDISCKEKKKSQMKKQFRRHRVGSSTEVNPNGSEMQDYATFAMETINAQSNAASAFKLLRIVKAAVQVVAGKNVFLTVEVGQTGCPKNENNCQLNENAEKQLCTVKIWDRPWLNDRRVTSVACKSANTQKNEKRLKRNTEKQKRLKHMTAFRSFMAKYSRVYKTWTEFELRYKIYRQNQAKIALLKRKEQGTAVYGDTPFSDLSENEFKKLYTGLNPQMRHPNAAVLPKAVIPNVALPDEFDWRTKDAVTPIKNQGQCGSCWAFSVTGNVEGQYAIRYGKLLSFSEQELVDCDKLDNGCNGGLPENAYKAIEELGGLELEQDYPYDGQDEKCQLVQNKTLVQVSGGLEISQNETEMAQWLIQNGPISIGINANAMQFYRGGVSHPWKFLCRPGGIDHGVLIVGYGVSQYPTFNKTLPYWIIKNSWGTGWGEQGYYRIYRGDGTCGVNMMATSAIVA